MFSANNLNFHWRYWWWVGLVMGLNPGYLLKSFLLYKKVNLTIIPNYRYLGPVSLFLSFFPKYSYTFIWFVLNSSIIKSNNEIGRYFSKTCNFPEELGHTPQHYWAHQNSCFKNSSPPPPNFGSWQLKFLMKFAQKVFARYAGAKLFLFFVSDNLLNSKGASHAKEEPTFHGLRTHDG